MTVPPKPASTVVLMRDRNNGSSQSEVLMVERNPNSLVGPGAYVFPGGVLEPQDGFQGIRPFSPPPTPEAAAAKVVGNSPPGSSPGAVSGGDSRNIRGNPCPFGWAKGRHGDRIAGFIQRGSDRGEGRVGQWRGRFFHMAGIGQPSPLYGKPDIFRTLDYAGGQSPLIFDPLFSRRSNPKPSCDSRQP